MVTGATNPVPSLMALTVLRAGHARLGCRVRSTRNSFFAPQPYSSRAAMIQRFQCLTRPMRAPLRSAAAVDQPRATAGLMAGEPLVAHALPLGLLALSLQQRLVKTGGRLVKHAYYWLLLAESHLTRRLFGAMLQRIWALPVPTG